MFTLRRHGTAFEAKREQPEMHKNEEDSLVTLNGMVAFCYHECCDRENRLNKLKQLATFCSL